MKRTRDPRAGCRGYRSLPPAHSTLRSFDTLAKVAGNTHELLPRYQNTNIKLLLQLHGLGSRAIGDGNRAGRAGRT